MDLKSADRPDSEQRKLHDLLSGIHTLMLTSVAPDGRLHSRPMAVLDHDDHQETELWFIADLQSDKAHEIGNDQHVNLSFTHGESRWVSISGMASTQRDSTRLRELWNPFAEAWFPHGLDNPNIGLVRVDVEQVDYWETSTPKPITLVKHAIAAATGRRPDVGESGTLRPAG